ncbi:MAG: putative metal-dependent hydrolase [Bacteroidetes bacterium]|nr:putative metal-dependent hydrolase [Bacteroidota bacterium]
MSDVLLDPIRFPIGRFEMPEVVTGDVRAGWIQRLDRLPARLRLAVAGLNEAQLDTPYREGGWTARQVVHHIADAHAHLSNRVRHALTEDVPTILPFEENDWAELPDARTAPVSMSLAVLNGTHARLAALLRTLDDDQWQRSIYHPARQAHLTVEWMAGMYAWHGDHHTAQIEAFRKRSGA